MKSKFLLFFLLGLSVSVFSQQTINGSITHDNLQRDYILYLPLNYDGSTSVPLVFNFHGYTSSASEQMFYGDFRAIADTAGFILVHPEGTLFNGNTHWNVGGWTLGSTVDDVGFTSALIDSLAADYNINLERVYSTGMSNGGYMSFLLACQLSDRIAAVASVTGSMTPETFNECSPQHPTPVMQIHGTSDSVVPYGGAAWTKPVEEAIDYWVNFNNCEMTPTVTPLDDINPVDGSTVEHFVYPAGDNGSTVEHFKVTGGDHTWPGTVFVFPGTNYDMDASAEIWRFFSRYDINGEIETTNTKDLTTNSLNIYPNPTSSILNIETDFTGEMNFEVISPIGAVILKGVLNSSKQTIDFSDLNANIYYLKIENRVYKILKTN